MNTGMQLLLSPWCLPDQWWIILNEQPSILTVFYSFRRHQLRLLQVVIVLYPCAFFFLAFRNPLWELELQFSSLHEYKKDSWSSLCSPPPTPTSFGGEAQAVTVRSFIPCAGVNSSPGAFVAQGSLFLWAKIFPKWKRETKMIDRLEPSLISCFADSLVMCTRCWCAGGWQLIDSPGLQTGEMRWACLVLSVYAALLAQAPP